jgi:pimeloyl-ACP methyl ester carboxylesterase
MAVVAGALLAVMIDLQSQLLFPVDAVAPAGPLARGAEQLELRIPHGDILRGVHIAPVDGSKERVLVLGFGGNAWNAQHVAELLHDIYPGAHVVAFHYRGYAPSTGSPSAEALLADAPLIYDMAVQRLRPARTIAAGFSIGSGVAAKLAAKRQLDGLILVTPFDSLKAVAQSLYPWVPVGPFFRHEIDAASALEHSGVPVAIVAAERDEIVAPERTAALRARIGNLVFDRTIEGAGHNDIYARSDFQIAMHEALDRLDL